MEKKEGTNNPLKTSATIVAKQILNDSESWEKMGVRELSNMIVEEALINNLKWVEAIRNHLGVWATKSG